MTKNLILKARRGTLAGMHLIDAHVLLPRQAANEYDYFTLMNHGKETVTLVGITSVQLPFKCIQHR